MTQSRLGPAVEKYYAPAEAALLLSFSKDWVLDRVAAGDFPGSVKIGDDYRIPASAINRYLQERALFSRGDVQIGIAARSIGELRRKAKLPGGKTRGH